MKSYMPSLNALRAFEVTARHRSMTQAAQELHVTHGAVSRQIQALETAMGMTLLKRNARSLEPTPEGTRLADDLTAAFGLIHAAVERTKPGPLILSCSSSITMCWLIPRMSGFYAKNPDIEIKLDMNHDKVDFSRDNISVAIRNSTITPPRNALIRDLGTEWIGPVCSPDYLKSSGLKRVSDLSRALVLSTATRPTAWADWLEAFFADNPSQQLSQLSPHRSFDHFYLLIQAAACGLGVAAVPYMLVLDELKSGRLIAPFSFVPGPRRLSLWLAPHLGSRRDVKSLEKWLTKELKHRTSAA